MRRFAVLRGDVAGQTLIRSDDRPTTWVVSGIALVREGLGARLAGDHRVTFVGASCPAEGLPADMQLPDVFVLDCGSARARDFVARLREHKDRTRIVGIAIGNSPTTLTDWVEAGVFGFVEDSGSIEDLVNAVLVVARGEFPCSPKTAAEVISGLIGRPRSPVSLTSRLTPREIEILARLECGASNKEIARRLGISSATVKNHVHHLLEKLAVSRRAEAAALLRSAR